MKNFLIALTLSLVTLASPQTVTRKIKIQHADPYLVLMLVSAGIIDFNLEPETSTRPFYTGGFSSGFGGGTAPGRGNGFGGR